MAMTKFRVTIQRTVKEEQEMELEAETYMEAFDQARKLTNQKQNSTATGSYSVIKVESIKELL